MNIYLETSSTLRLSYIAEILQQCFKTVRSSLANQLRWVTRFVIIIAIWLAIFADSRCLSSLLHIKDTKLKTTLQGHSEEVVSLAFSPDSKTLASGSDDALIKLWDVSTGKNTSTLKSEPGSGSWKVAYSPDGKMLASGGINIIKMWTLGTGSSSSLRDKSMGFKNPMVMFSPDGKKLISGGRCINKMILWDLSNHDKIAVLEGYDIWGVSAMAFTPDSKTLISMGFNGELISWNVTTSRVIAKKNIEHGSDAAAFSPDGKTLATANMNDNIKLWDVSSGKEIATFKGHTSGVLVLAFSPNGKILAAGHGDDNSVNLWDVTSGKELITFEGHLDKVGALTFSPDGKILATGSWDKTIKVWDLTKVP